MQCRDGGGGSVKNRRRRRESALLERLYGRPGPCTAAPPVAREGSHGRRLLPRGAPRRPLGGVARHVVVSFLARDCHAAFLGSMKCAMSRSVCALLMLSAISGSPLVPSYTQTSCPVSPPPSTCLQPPCGGGLPSPQGPGVRTACRLSCSIVSAPSSRQTTPRGHDMSTTSLSRRCLKSPTFAQCAR